MQETRVIPLYGRKRCSGLYPNLFRDETETGLDFHNQILILDMKSAWPAKKGSAPS